MEKFSPEVEVKPREVQRQAGPAARVSENPLNFPGHFPFSTCFSLLIIFLFKYYDVGGTTELPSSVVREEAIRRDAGFQVIPDLTAPCGRIRVLPSFPGPCASGRWEGLWKVLGCILSSNPSFLAFSCRSPSWRLPHSPQLSAALPKPPQSHRGAPRSPWPQG